MTCECTHGIILIVQVYYVSSLLIIFVTVLENIICKKKFKSANVSKCFWYYYFIRSCYY